LAAAELAARVNPQVVAQLEALLAAAQRGEITDIAGAAIGPRGEMAPFSIIAVRPNELHTGICLIQQNILSHIGNALAAAHQKAQQSRILRPAGPVMGRG
jgi:hypothetical protein